jgi:hypothetical protein
LDLLTKSVFEAAAATDMPTASVNKLLAILRTALSPDDEAVLLRTCNRADRKWQGELVLTVTRTRLVLTRERLFRGIQWYLDAERDGLADVRWGAHQRWPLLELSFDYHGIGYLLWLWARQPQQMVALESALARAFGGE